MTTFFDPVKIAEIVEKFHQLFGGLKLMPYIC